MIVPGLLSPKHPLLDPTRSVLGTGLPWESGGGGAPWSPLALGSKLKLWLDERGQVGSPIDSIANHGDAAGSYSGAGANRPPVGSLGGVTPVPDYDGSNDRLEGGPALSAIISASAYHGFCVVRVDTIAREFATPTYLSPAIVCDVGQFWGLFVRDSTVGAGTAYVVDAYHWDAGIKASSDTIALATDTLVEWRYDGSKIYVRVGAAAETAGTTAASVGGLAGATQLGADASDVYHVDGKVGEILVCNAALSAAERTSTRAYLATKFGVAA